MASREGYPSMPEVFRKVVQEIDLRNDEGARQARLLYALDNSYENQIERIETFISKLSLERSGGEVHDDASPQLARATE